MKIRITLLTLLLTSTIVFAQDEYTIKEVSFTVYGSSTLHDWEMKTSEVKGQVNFNVDNNKLIAVKEFTLDIPAESLKSEKEAMDKNAYKSLKTAKHKIISFQIPAPANFERSGTTYSVNTPGKLQIAGVTKSIPIKAICTIDNSGNIHCTGEKTFKMTDFNVEPPTFMFGSIKTGDEIKVVFDVRISKNQIVPTSN